MQIKKYFYKTIGTVCTIKMKYQQNFKIAAIVSYVSTIVTLVY